MSNEVSKHEMPSRLSNPADVLHCLHAVLKATPPVPEEIKRLLTVYDGLWAGASVELKTNWSGAIGEEFRHLIPVLQVRLRKDFPPFAAGGKDREGSREALEWRERLNRWVRDPFLKADLWEVIHKSPYAMKVSRAIGILYRISENTGELDRSQSKVREELLRRIHSSADDADPVACENAIRVLAIQASCERTPGEVDMAVCLLLKGDFLPLRKGGVVQLLMEMYGEHRQVLYENQENAPESQGSGWSGQLQPGRFAEEYELIRQGEKSGGFPPIPMEYLDGCRAEVTKALLNEMSWHPSSIGNAQLDLLRTMLDAMSEGKFRFWQEKLDENVYYSIMKRPEREAGTDVRQRARIYESMAPYMTENMRLAMWDESIVRSLKEMSDAMLEQYSGRDEAEVRARQKAIFDMYNATQLAGLELVRIENGEENSVYEFTAPYLAENVRVVMSNGDPPSPQPDGKEPNENFLLKTMVNSAELQLLMKMMETETAKYHLPTSVKGAVLERLTERTAELPWWKETPSRDLEHRLRQQMEREKPVRERKEIARETGGVTYEEWENHVAALPVVNDDNHNYLLIKAVSEQTDNETERKIYRRAYQAGKHPGGFAKDNDPLVFHLVPRLEGQCGQPYFGLLFEKLAEYGSRAPKRYVPHLEEVGKVLNKEELLKTVGRESVVEACRQNSSVAVTVIGLLNRLGEKENDSRIEAAVRQMRTILMETGEQTGMGQPPVVPQALSVPLVHQASPPQTRPPGGLTR